MSHKEIIDCFVDWHKTNNPESRRRVIDGHLGLVTSIARKKVQGFECSLTYNDLIAAGCEGLTRAFLRFDVSRGIHFSTYATWWIRQVIDRAIITEGRMIRIPAYMSGEVSALRRLIAEAMLGEDVNDDEITRIAAENGICSIAVSLLNHRTNSLDAPYGDSDSSLGEFFVVNTVDPEEAVIIKEKQEFVREVIGILTEREKLIIIFRYGLFGEAKLTLEKVGKKINLTRERVRQLQLSALKKLKAQQRNNKQLHDIKSFFD